MNRKSMHAGILMLCIAVITLIMLTTPLALKAESFTYDTMDITFMFPQDEMITTVVESDNYVNFVDNDSSSIQVIVSDLYYEVTQADPKLEQRYPKDDVWIGCGLFEETWNDLGYVTQYLSDIVNASNTKYYGSTELLQLNGLPFFKFSYFDETQNTQSPGGIIYLTLYRSKLYTVSFSNFFSYATAANYGTAFENSVMIEGIDTYTFEEFKDINISAIILIGGASIILIMLFIGITINRSRRKKLGEGIR